MLNWTQFGAHIAAGQPNANMLDLLARLESWLELSLGGAVPAMSEELKNTPPLLLYRAMFVLNLTLQRESGIPSGPEAVEATQKIFNKVQEGSATEEEKKIAARFGVLWELFGALLKDHPELKEPVSPAAQAKMELQAAATALFKRTDPVAGQLSAGTVTPHAIEVYESVIADARALAASASAENEALAYVLSMTASAERAAAGGCAQLGRFADALKLLGDAADDFTRAGEPGESQDCTDRKRTLEQQIAGGLDATAGEALGTLVGDAAHPDQEPVPSWERLRALMKLVEVSGAAADSFEARQYAEQACETLAQLGYVEPHSSSLESDFNQWIGNACEGFAGNALLARLIQVCMFFDGILGARLAATVKKNPREADQLQSLQFEIQRFESAVQREARVAVAENQRRFRRYFPPPPGTDTNVDDQDSTAFDKKMERMRALDAALLKSQQTSNERAAAGAPLDDLLENIGKLEAEADSLDSPLYEAKARLGRAYILYQQGRGAELRPVAQEARRRLLAGRPPSLSSFAQSYERYYYLESLRREVEGSMMLGDFETSLRICEETIRDFETQRYRVNSEYRQSALLSYVSFFYTWAAFSAFKLQRWDNMLEAIDLIKARSAIRNSLIPDSPHLGSTLQTEFDQVNTALEKDPGNQDLKTKRRQIWDLLSISAGNQGNGVQAPSLTQSSLQAALDADEALIAYFWLAESVVLTVAVDRDRFHAERISFNPEQLARLQRFIKFIQKLETSHDMDAEVSRLGALLLPQFLRDFIRGKKRIIISPHHSLHLFPFHGVRWETGGFVGTEFAVSYTANFSSVILPWTQAPRDRILAIGIRQFANDYAGRLENVEDDARTIADSYRNTGTGTQLMLGEDATRAQMQALHDSGAIRQFRCVHLGTHGLSVFESPDQPLESRILLEDGPMDAMMLATLGLNAELVVMSACHSGQRAIELRDLGEIPGDEIFGLQAALFKSGVRTILGTLWPVETDSASPITRAFHSHYAQGEPAEVALQQSIRDYLAHPVDELTGVYYWAPYFVSFIGRKQEEATSHA